MSKRFGMIPEHMVKAKNLTAKERHLLEVLYLHADKSGKAFPSRKLIAEYLGLDRPNRVTDYATRLLKKGYILKRERQTRHTVYWLPTHKTGCSDSAENVPSTTPKDGTKSETSHDFGNDFPQNGVIHITDQVTNQLRQHTQERVGFSDEDLKLARELLNKHRPLRDEQSTAEAWAEAIAALPDEATAGEVKACMALGLAHVGFFARHIISPAGFLKHFPQLIAQMEAQQKADAENNPTDPYI